MDSTDLERQKSYRDIIEQVLLDYAAIPYALEPDIERKVVFDRQRDSYLLVINGWGYDGKRVNGTIIHIDIMGGKVWIQRDGTESGVVGDLEEMGVPKDQIVLGFQQPDVRKLSGYAAS